MSSLSSSLALGKRFRMSNVFSRIEPCRAVNESDVCSNLYHLLSKRALVFSVLGVASRSTGITPKSKLSKNDDLLGILYI